MPTRGRLTRKFNFADILGIALPRAVPARTSLLCGCTVRGSEQPGSGLREGKRSAPPSTEPYGQGARVVPGKHLAHVTPLQLRHTMAKAFGGLTETLPGLDSGLSHSVAAIWLPSSANTGLRVGSPPRLVRRLLRVDLH